MDNDSDLHSGAWAEAGLETDPVLRLVAIDKRARRCSRGLLQFLFQLLYQLFGYPHALIWRQFRKSLNFPFHQSDSSLAAAEGCAYLAALSSGYGLTGPPPPGCHSK